MTAPRLTHPLVLEAAQQVSDGAGGYTTQWRALGTHWADLRPRSGREAAGVAGPISRVPMVITLRGCPPSSPARPKAGQRFRAGDRIFAILAVSEADGTGRYLNVTAEEEISL